MIRFIAIGGTALLLGGMIYLLLRPNTYIAQALPEYFWLKSLREQLQWPGLDFLRSYFADYLWGLSLCCGLHILFKPRRKGSLICAITTIIYGGSLELLQYTNILSGTGDLWDIFMFILAGLTAIIINEKKEKQK